VIPCCVDMSRFRHNTSEDRTAARARLGLDRRRAIAYVGSFGGWYMTEEMLDLFAAAREADKTTYAMILTQRDHEPIKDGLRRRGFDDADMLVTRAAPADLQQYLVAADVAISLIKPCYSKLSSSPTKIAEYLAAGVPIIANRGVGDVDELIDANGVGALLDGFDKPSYRKALSHVEHLGDIREKCIATAVREFDLGAVAGERYRRLYERLVERE
jgi:glycosyltransferase involved in cell wall biosynthesis